MVVDGSKTIVINKEHSIEFGQASWDNTQESVRRRKNTSNGGFDPYSSSEIPINGFLDISYLLCECLKKDKIDNSSMTAIIKEILESAKRKKSSVSITII